jgi:antitoxin component YwqK of YwqJK toxin-antitoxin module
MKRFLILIVAVLFSIAAIGQQDSGGYTGVKKAYYVQKNKKLLKETPYVHGKKDGVVKSYYKNGNLKQEIAYKDGERNGLFVTYWENGNKRFEILFVNKKNRSSYFLL